DRRRRGAEMARERVAAARREAEPEALDRFLRDPALAEVGTAARARRPTQRGAEEGGGGLVDGDERLAARAGARRLGRHRKAEPRGDDADRLGEREGLGLHHEAEDVAVLAAAEAVVETALLADVEGRRLLAVEGAEAERAPAAPLERHHVRDDVGDARALADVADRVLAEEPPRHGQRPSPAAEGRLARRGAGGPRRPGAAGGARGRREGARRAGPRAPERPPSQTTWVRAVRRIARLRAAMAFFFRRTLGFS